MNGAEYSPNPTPSPEASSWESPELASSTPIEENGVGNHTDHETSPAVEIGVDDAVELPESEATVIEPQPEPELREPAEVDPSRPVAPEVDAPATIFEMAVGPTELPDEEEEDEEEEEAPRPSPFSKPTTSRPDEGEFERLFAEWKATGDPRLRERLILMHRNLVTYLARRFMDRGELFEDVMQIGMLGLINALDAFDSSRGVKFSTFATPTIAGEIRRYFRDKVSGMRVPRRMQELYGVIQNKVEELTQKLDRSPTYAEIAFALEIEVEEVIETLELSNALEPMSLDDAVFGEKDSSATFLADTIGGPDPALESYEEHAALQMALSRLSEKERRVLEMAYFHGHSQAEIARRLGVSQMHISRLLRKALAQLKNLLEDG